MPKYLFPGYRQSRIASSEDKKDEEDEGILQIFLNLSIGFLRHLIIK